MEAIKVAISVDFRRPSLIGDMICDNDGDSRQFDDVSSNRGTCAALGSLSWTKKQDTELYKSNYLISRPVTEDASSGMDHGITNGSIALITGLEAKQAQRRLGKFPKIGSGSLGKLKMFQGDDVSHRAENGDAKMESDMLGLHFVKCSNAVEKHQPVKQRNNINGKRGDRRNSRVPMKAKFDPFALKAGVSTFSPSGGGSNVFGMYGLKPDVQDVTKFMEDISLDELLDETYNRPILDKYKGKRALNVNNDVLDSVRKVCSVIRPQRMQQDKQTEELDIHTNTETPLPSSPSNNHVENGSNGDGSTIESSSKCNKDLETCVREESSTNYSERPLYQPRDVLERLALPPPKDLESLMQDAAKPASSMKQTDSRSSKQLSHIVSLPPFPWSHNFNGHYKSNNDTPKTSSKSTCCGRWVKISSKTGFIGGSEGFVDLESLTYDDGLVPAGQLKYRLPEVEKTSTTLVSQHFSQPEASRAASLPLPVTALHPPKVLSAARTLCDMAHFSKHNPSGILKWPKQPSQKAMKARKSRLVEIPEEGLLAPKSETVLNHVVRRVEHGSSSKKPKMSLIETRESYSHVQAVMGLSSVSAPRSNRSSKDSISDRHLNGSFVKSSYMVPPPPRVLDRSSNQNPQKLRKITPIDWNRSRS